MRVQVSRSEDDISPVVEPDEQLFPDEVQSGTVSCGDDPDVWLYRGRTVSLLNRYLRQSVEVGRLPSLLGREFFRSKVSHCRVSTFEDSVIFVHDMDRCLEQLDEFELMLIATVIFQDYTQDEAAVHLHCQRRTIGRRFHEGLDKLSELLLQGGWITPLPKLESEPCQEGESSQNPVSDSNYGENNFESDVPFYPLSVI